MTQEHQNPGEFTVGDRHHSGLTMRALCALWLSKIKTQVSAASFQNYERTVNCHILPVLGDTEVDYLTKADVSDFLREKLTNGRMDGKGGLSVKTVTDISSILRSVLKLVEWDYSFILCEQSFVDSPHMKRDIELMTVAQAEQLTRYLTRNLNRSNGGFLLCLFTGIRLSEICSLKDSDFCLAEDRIQIRRTLQRVTMPWQAGMDATPPTVEYTPTDSYYRDLVLPPRLSMLLWSLLRSGSGNAYFLTDSEHTPLGSRAYQKRFQKVLNECELPSCIHFHMLRHTFALLWLLRSDDLEGLSHALGHGSLRVTQNRYSKILETVNAMLPQCAKYLCVDVVSGFPEK